MFDQLVARQDAGQPIGRDIVLASASIDEAPVVMKEWDHTPEGTPLEEILGLLRRGKESVRRQHILQKIAATEELKEKRKLMEQLNRKEGIS